jgi:Tfp pilus assembly protein PilV
MLEENFKNRATDVGVARRRHPRGFTIFEVMMATFVMAMGITTSVIGITSSLKTLDVARNITLASQVLQSEMELLRLKNWADIAAMTGTSSVDLSSMFTGDAALTARFTLTRTVSDLAGKVGEMKNIQLVCTWTALDGRVISRQFSTYYTKNGLYDFYYTLARP